MSDEVKMPGTSTVETIQCPCGARYEITCSAAATARIAALESELAEWIRPPLRLPWVRTQEYETLCAMAWAYLAQARIAEADRDRLADEVDRLKRESTELRCQVEAVIARWGEDADDLLAALLDALRCVAPLAVRGETEARP